MRGSRGINGGRGQATKKNKKGFFERKEGRSEAKAPAAHGRSAETAGSGDKRPGTSVLKRGGEGRIWGTCWDGVGWVPR